MTQYEPVIGLEVHAQLKTKTKIFCSCPTTFGVEPNHNTCPVCLGLPGVLPVLNEQAATYAVMAGLALGCNIQQKSIWARKNYFYPDLPKGYQITQFEHPICLGGKLQFYVGDTKKTIGITRIHMEEDAGKLMHDYGDSNSSHVDLNRAGTPLIEIVSEPELRSSSEASGYLKQLRNILMYLDVCDGNMEEGSFRCDANVSIRPVGTEKFGTRVELKNINSFKFVEQAIEYEIARQEAAINDGKTIVQETRLFNNAKGVTESMRSKEDAHDYRYFPDPDLLPLILSEASIQKIKAAMPELGFQKIERFQTDHEIPRYDAEVLCAEKAIAEHWEASVKLLHKITPAKNISNLYMSHLLKLEKDIPETFSRLTPQIISEVLSMSTKGELSGNMVKDLLELIAQTGRPAAELIAEKGMKQVSDTGAIEKIIDEIIAANPDNVAQYKSGKEKLFGFFVGQTMKALGGKGNPSVINDLLKKRLSF